MARVAHDKYTLTWLNGRAHASWKDASGEKRRMILKDRDKQPLKKATATVAELRAALVAFAARQSKEDVRAQGVLIGPVLDAYEKHRIADGKQAHPIDTQVKALKKFFADMHPHDVTEQLCKDYVVFRAYGGKGEKDESGKSNEQVIANSTLLSEIQRLSTALRWAAKRDMVEGWRNEDDVPVMWFPQPSDARDRFLTADEALALINGATERHVRLFILLALYTGARKTAILELTWDRVDFEAGRINYKTAVVKELLKKKSRKGRGTPPVPAEILAELRLAKVEAETSHVIEFRGKSVDDVKKGFAAARDRAGLGDDVTAHTLRHTFATWAEEMGVPASAVARALGHKKESTTKENYQHAQTEAARPAVDAVAAKLRLRAINGGKS